MAYNSATRLDSLCDQLRGVCCFLGELASKEFTEMFVSRKNLPLIHLVPTEPRLPCTCFKRVINASNSCVPPLCAVNCSGHSRNMAFNVLYWDLAHKPQAPLLDQLFISTEGDVFHAWIVHTSSVLKSKEDSSDRVCRPSQQEKRYRGSGLDQSMLRTQIASGGRSVLAAL
jgi:hypothetical protein